MNRGDEKRSRLTVVVEAVLNTGTSVPSVIDMLATVFRGWKFVRAAELLENAVGVLMGGPSDVEQIATWFEEQAAKESELLDSGRCNNTQLTQERWLVYMASAQSVRASAWRKAP